MATDSACSSRADFGLLLSQLCRSLDVIAFLGRQGRTGFVDLPLELLDRGRELLPRAGPVGELLLRVGKLRLESRPRRLGLVDFQLQGMDLLGRAALGRLHLRLCLVELRLERLGRAAGGQELAVQSVSLAPQVGHRADQPLDLQPGGLDLLRDGGRLVAGGQRLPLLGQASLDLGERRLEVLDRLLARRRFGLGLLQVPGLRHRPVRRQRRCHRRSERGQ